MVLDPTSPTASAATHIQPGQRGSRAQEDPIRRMDFIDTSDFYVCGVALNA
jgi:hypothetical protein